MLKSKLFIFMAATSLAAGISMTGCVSTPEQTTNDIKPENEGGNIIEVVDESANINKREFLESIKDVSIKIVSAPRIATVGNEFVRPFTIAVTDGQGAAKVDFPISIRYPSSKIDGEVVFTTENVTTDANGKYVFTAPKLTFPCCEDFAVYPTPISNNKDVIAAVTEKAALTPWDVKSDIANRGCSLVVWDFNELGKAPRNSMEIQGELRSRGIYNVGNAPFSDASLVNNSMEKIYKQNYDILKESGSANGYMLYGTIKFEAPVTALEEGGYTCTLIGDIKCLEMKDGSVVLEKVFEQTATGKNWNEVVSKCKNKLASKVVDSLLYDLN